MRYTTLAILFVMIILAACTNQASVPRSEKPVVVSPSLDINPTDRSTSATKNLSGSVIWSGFPPLSWTMYIQIYDLNLDMLDQGWATISGNDWDFDTDVLVSTNDYILMGDAIGHRAMSDWTTTVTDYPAFEFSGSDVEDLDYQIQLYGIDDEVTFSGDIDWVATEPDNWTIKMELRDWNEDLMKIFTISSLEWTQDFNLRYDTYTLEGTIVGAYDVDKTWVGDFPNYGHISWYSGTSETGLDYDVDDS